MTSARIKPALFAAAIVAMALADRLDYLPFVATAIQVLAAALCFGLLLIRPVSNAQTDAAARLNPLASALLGAAGAIAGAFGWVAGAPGFAHDWKWPLDAVQSHDQLATLGSIWLPWGSGAPAVQALGTYPITLLSWILGYLLPSNFALLALLACIGACGGVGAGLLAARIGLAKPYQAVLALTFAAMPVWFNRLNAGHLQWLLAYALFPGALALAMSSMRARRVAGGLGALWGVAGGQAQFMLFFPLAALPFAARSRRLIPAAIGALLMLGLQIPAIVAMAYAVHANAFAQQRTNLTWQSAQSDPLAMALLSGADAAHYFAHWETPVAFALSFGALILIAAGAFRNAFTRVLAAIWLLSAIWSSGLDGPLRSPMAWLFTHVPDAIVLREFTHAQAVTAPIVAILAAAGAAAMLRTSRAPAWAGAVLLFVALLPLTFAAFSGAVTRTTASVAPSPDRDAIVDTIRALPQSGQILWWPGLAPVSVAGTRGGVDSDAFVTGTHAPYAEYRPTAALAQAIVALAAGDRATCGLLADLGVQAVVVRDGTSVPPGAAFASLSLPSANDLTRAGLREIAKRGPYHLYEVPCYRGRFTVANDAALRGDWSSIVPIARRFGATDEITSAPQPPQGCSSAPFDAASYDSTDIARDWVPLSSLDPLFLNYDNAFDEVFLTRDRSRQVTTWVLAATANASYTWMSPQLANRRLDRTLAVWKMARCSGAAKPSLGTAATGAIARPLADGTIELQRASLVVAHYGRIAGWNLIVNGKAEAKSVLADGFASGWLLRPGEWQIAFIPSGPPAFALWALVILTAASALALVYLPRRDR
ncbi:MAG TPA: hypothetical protein VMG98_09525 [Verrucomicrobiae bacterium]|nr:hypothetical protein [Verrucomicrobiae bacterium]